MKLERTCIIVHVREEEFYIAIAPPVVGCARALKNLCFGPVTA
jgi:hypothetical protein